MNLAPHPFTLRQLQYALAVADLLSFRKAAERCHVSQPSLSAQIAELEENLGVQLFERSRRGVLVTTAGGAILERARSLLRDANDVQELAQRSRDPLAGTLHLGVIPTIAPYLLPPLTPALHRAFPKLRLLWVEDKTENLVRNLESGTLDAALLALEADIGDLERSIVGRDPFVLATPEGHPLSCPNTPARQAELNHASVLLLDDGHCFRDQALAFCSHAHANELEFRATSLPTLVQMVAAGAGVTLLPELSLPVETARAQLAIRPFQNPIPGRTIALVWRKRSAVIPALQALAAVIRDHYPTSTPPKSGRRR